MVFPEQNNECSRIYSKDINICNVDQPASFSIIGKIIIREIESLEVQIIRQNTCRDQRSHHSQQDVRPFQELLFRTVDTHCQKEAKEWLYNHGKIDDIPQDPPIPRGFFTDKSIADDLKNEMRNNQCRNPEQKLALPSVRNATLYRYAPERSKRTAQNLRERYSKVHPVQGNMKNPAQKKSCEEQKDISF